MNRYLVLLIRRPGFDSAAVPLHLAFLDEMRRDGRIELSGRFSDASGGAYLLRAADLAEANAIVHRDPAHVSGGWDITIREWLAH